MAKVSVVVPIYNAQKKLKKCISSILDQTFHDFELILVNDGSTDSSREICEKYKKQDKRVILIHKENAGCIAARRTGVEASTAPYVMFVDADDWIDKKAIEVLYEETVRDDVDITVCNSYKVLGDAAIVKQKNDSLYFRQDRIYGKDKIKNDLIVAYLHGHPFPANLFAKLYKKELLISSGKYLQKLIFMGEDLYYNLEMFLKADRIKVMV